MDNCWERGCFASNDHKFGSSRPRREWRFLLWPSHSSEGRCDDYCACLGRACLRFQRKGKFECPNERKKEVMSKIEEEARGAKIDRTDGLKIWTDDESWILVRPSGTEPLIRIYAESGDEEKLGAMYERYEGILRSALHST